jgi:hypothetical protein
VSGCCAAHHLTHPVLHPLLQLLLVVAVRVAGAGCAPCCCLRAVSHHLLPGHLLAP